MDPVIDDERPILRQQALHQAVEAANVDAPVPHQLQPGRVDPAVLREGPVDRVRVDALNPPAAASKVLSEDARDQRLSDSSLSL